MANMHGFTHMVCLADRIDQGDLPAEAGIYVVLRKDQAAEGGWRILYVGKSMCLSCRARSTGHHVLAGLRGDADLYLLARPLPGVTAAELAAFERESIKNLSPELNRAN